MTENTLRYVKLDYQSHKDALLQRARERWPNAWNDFLANTILMVFVDLAAWGFATLAYVLNRISAENFIPTMSLRESAVRLGGLTGYQLQSAAPATVACEAVLVSPATATVMLLKGTMIRTSDAEGVPFELAQDYTIEAGELTPKTLVVTLSPALSGAKVLNTYMLVTAGSVNVDSLDSTVSLADYVAVGQSFNKLGEGAVYIIQSIEAAPGAVSLFSRLVLDRAYEGATGMVGAEVYDCRIQLVQGQTVIDQFISPIGDTSAFSVKLSRTPVIDSSVSVTVNGAIWTQVVSTALRDFEDQVFQLKTLISGTSLILFGDGSFGAAVPAQASIVVTYRIGGGIVGNIALNSINTSIAGLIESLSNPVAVTISNSTSTGIGGQEAETIEQARVNIPAYTRTNDRAVTLEDYQTIAQQYRHPQFGSVAFVRSSIRTENSFLEGNMVVLYAWTTGSAGGLVVLSPQLKQALQTYMQTKAIGTDLVQVFDGSSRPVPVSLRIKVFAGFNVSDTKRLVSNTIKSAVNALRPGDPILYSNLLRSLDEVYGVDTVNMATPITDLFAANPTELFTVPQDSFVYAIQRNGVGSPQVSADGVTVGMYTAQLPVYPLAAWSCRLFLGLNELTILPDVDAGYARLMGENLSSDTSDAFWSQVNLLTGQVTLWLKGAPGDLTMQLVTVQGYLAERTVNLYIGYTGDNTATKRREIRAALRSWSDGLSIGGYIYAQQVSNVSASTVSVTDVVSRVSGVDSVIRVALDTPASSASRVVAADYELLRVGTCYLNNSVD